MAQQLRAMTPSSSPSSSSTTDNNDNKDSSAIHSIDMTSLPGFTSLSTDGQQFVLDLFHPTNPQPPFTDFYESHNPAGPSSSSSSSSSSVASGKVSSDGVPMNILALHRQLTNSSLLSSTERKRLTKEMKRLMNIDMVGETKDTSDQYTFPTPPNGMRYCLQQRCFVEIYNGSSGIHNYGKTNKKTKTIKKMKDLKANVLGKRSRKVIVVTCDVCGNDCSEVSYLCVGNGDEDATDYCVGCVTEHRKRDCVLQSYGEDDVSSTSTSTSTSSSSSSSSSGGGGGSSSSGGGGGGKKKKNNKKKKKK